MTTTPASLIDKLQDESFVLPGSKQVIVTLEDVERITREHFADPEIVERAAQEFARHSDFYDPPAAEAALKAAVGDL